MHKNFAEWYRLVRVEPKGDMLDNRWAGVEEWATSLRDEDDAVLETVRIFQGFPQVTSREAFFAVFRKHDSAFQQRNNELEQRVLAGAAIVQLVKHDDDADDGDLRSAVLAGTAVAASRLCATDGPLEELVEEVLDGLHEMARHQRRRRGFDATLLTDEEEKSFAKTIETNVGDHNQLRASFASAFQLILKAVHRSESALCDAAHDLRCADEETNILWWLEGECSRDLNKPWSALKDGAPVIAGWELADLTDVALGPHDAAALLERVVSSAKGKSNDQPLHTYVNAVSDDWAKARATDLPERALDLTPLTFALSLRARSGTSSWQQFFEKTGQITPTLNIAPEVVAKHAYVEAVFLRTLAVMVD
jgi:hypothetical protein